MFLLDHPLGHFVGVGVFMPGVGVLVAVSTVVGVEVAIDVGVGVLKYPGGGWPCVNVSANQFRKPRISLAIGQPH